MIITPVPINTLGWFVAMISAGLMSLQMWRHYRASNNYLTKLLLIFMVVLTFNFGFGSVPALLTRDTDIIRLTIVIADIFRYGALVIIAYFVWFTVLKHRFAFVWIGLPVVALATAGWVDGLLHTQISFAPLLVVYNYPELNLLAKVSLIVIFVLLSGVFFIIQGLREIRSKNLAGSVKSLSLAFGFLTVGGLIVLNHVANRGAETVASGIAVAAIFLIILAGLQLKPVKRMLSASSEAG